MSIKRRIDTIVIGGSAGALAPLKTLLQSLPADFPACLLVCLHRSHLHTITLSDLLRDQIPLPIFDAEDEMKIRTGSVIVASSDHHMLIGSDHIHLRRGAHENNFRPAVDPLFRSAAVYRGSRSIAVVLSGLLNDGAVGARTIAQAGGTVLVLDPAEADFPDMPNSVLQTVSDAKAMSLSQISETLISMAGTEAGAEQSVPWQVGVELKIASLEGNSVSTEERLGELTPYNCPHCNGVLWEIDDPDILRFRCHTGHGYTADALNAAQSQALEEGLWDALRAHKGRAELLRRLSEESNGETSRHLLETRAKKVEEDAERLESIIAGRKKTATG